MMPLTSWLACTYRISVLNLVRISTSRWVRSWKVIAGAPRSNEREENGGNLDGNSTGLWVPARVANELCLLRELHAPSKKFLFNLTYPNRVSTNFPLYLTNFVCPFALFCLASILLFARQRAFPERSFQNRFFCAVFGRFFVRTKDKKRLRE